MAPPKRRKASEVDEREYPDKAEKMALDFLGEDSDQDVRGWKDCGWPDDSDLPE